MRILTRRLLTVAAAVAVVIPLAAAPVQASGTKKPYVKVGYFTQWGIYGRNFVVADLEKSGAASRLTHINYAFGNVTTDARCVSADPWAEHQYVGMRLVSAVLPGQS